MELPDRASPGGCVVGFFGLLSLTLSGFFWRAYFLAGKLEDSERAEEVSEAMMALGTLSFVAGLAILFVSWRLIRNCDMSSPLDPDRPKMRF